MRALIAAALHQRLVIVVVALILLFFGLNAAQHLSVDAFPDVTNVQVQIATEAAGKSPEEVERFITVPIEIGMTGLPGLQEMRSLNKPGLSLITLVFEDGKGVYFERQLVSERLNELRDRMPEGVTPLLGPVSNALGEVYQYTLERTDDGQRALTHDELVERRTVEDWVVRPLLRSIPGVAEINSTGGYVKEYQTLVDPQKLRYYGLTIEDVFAALKRNNANAGGGILPQHSEQYLIRSIGLIRDADDIRNIVLKESAATPVYIKDVATVQVGQEVRYGAMVKGGYTEAVGGVVMAIAGGNAKEIVSKVKAKVEKINAENKIPGGLKIVPYYDRSRLVDAAIHTVTEVLAEGVVLVVVVLFLYLGDLRSSLIVSANLLLTPLLTFLVMNHVGLSANLMSLGGLAIAIGLMVDGSVVVVENVFARLSHEQHDSRLHTVRDAVVEVATPVIFGVLIIVLVFLPLMTLEGTSGKMFAPLAYTIAIALLISLALSLSLSPALSMFFLKAGKENDTWLVAMLRKPYNRILAVAMSNKRKSIFAVLLLLAGTLCLFPFLGTAFIPEMQEGTLGPNADRVPNISLQESIKMELRMQSLMRDIPGVQSVVSRLGRGESPADPAGPNEADVLANLVPVDDRPRDLTQEKIADEMRHRLAAIPGINLVMAQPISDRVDEMVSGVRADVAVKIFGDDLDTLIEKAQQVAKVAASVSGTQDTRVDRVGGQQYLTIEIDRAAIARYALNASDVNDTIEMAIAGKSATEIYEGERRFQAIVRLPDSDRDTVEKIKEIMVSSPNGIRVPLEDLARIRVSEGPAQINREMGKRRIVVGINVQGRDLGGYVTELERSVRTQVPLPPGYSFEWGGQFQNMQRAMHHLMIIVPVTIGAIFFLLFLLFHSVRFAALIITVLPFASIGGVLGLFVSREYLSVPASVGFIALWGIAVLNGVVLVSYIRKLRGEGLSQAEAVTEGTRLRFRPVMMTATVAALGLVPFLFARGPGSEIQRPLAIVVIGGLITSTFLTLVIVPCLYAWFEGGPREIADREMESHLLS
ncbi:efflux RND transporter permease subunit [Occallatibacter riparius]|uniref:CusA/CzcA family heavy metal efflux RND transporter n=1 Tax=Occallatibacter riparius TaxID=1002689 RepID=A0A9J7BUH9_9BACT|nr:CusA/CzcA family heavy metal efflux RND transporter [Occallatibacter riparius]UWZ85402.1 CusA/CzcA family heavy metal efflux RND transporter [Occallatibacter riparius]